MRVLPNDKTRQSDTIGEKFASYSRLSGAPAGKLDAIAAAELADGFGQVVPDRSRRKVELRRDVGCRKPSPGSRSTRRSDR